MTTTVKRGAGRPAATAKSNRHAQRTPLPPKPGMVADAKAAITDSERILGEEEGTERQLSYGRMTQPELHARAVQLKIGRRTASGRFIPIAKSTPKGDLLTAILKAERAEAKVSKQLQPSKLDADLDAAFGEPKPGTWAAEVTTRLDSKSGQKAEAFVAEALRLGWEASAALPSDADLVTVTARRGEETIIIEWLAGVFQDNCHYAHNGRTPIKLRNASAAKQRMAVPPAKAHEEAARVTAHKAVKAKAGKPASVARRLPFTEASLDQEVLDALYGKTITWTNRVSGTDETDRVPAVAETVRLGDGTPGRKKQNHAPRIAEGPSGRVLEFVGSTGFRSVLVSQITRVR